MDAVAVSVTLRAFHVCRRILGEVRSRDLHVMLLTSCKVPPCFFLGVVNEIMFIECVCVCRETFRKF